MSREELNSLVDLYLEAYEGLEAYAYRRRRDAKSYVRWLYSRDPEGILAAKLEDELVGFVASDAHWTSKQGRVGAIHELVVKQEFRGRGIGKKLLTTALERFRRCGLKRTELWVGVTNPAIEFYRKLGFKEDDRLGAWLKMYKLINDSC